MPKSYFLETLKKCPGSLYYTLLKMQEIESPFSIKDHKEDFPHKISCRLINPSSSNIGKISKHVLDKVNQKLLLVIKVNQWKNSDSVIEWFKNIRSNPSFFVFGIKSFYP